MGKQNKIFQTAIKYTLFVVMLLIIIFVGITFLWIAITPYVINDFSIVLSLCIKNAGSYSVLLVGIVVTIFFQIYAREKEMEKEDRIKIGEIGYYTLAFKREDDNYSEEFRGDKIVVEINKEKDYSFSSEITCGEYLIAPIKFLTSKEISTNLKNIMAFGEDYFDKNKKKILKNYYQYCERITYASPLYCSTKPTCELDNNKKADINRYFWIVLTDLGERGIKSFWISAVTEEGILLFIKVKVRLETANHITHITLLQQTTYYKSNNRLCALYR